MINSNEMKKNRLLMICYYYPPIRTSAIARSVGFAKNISNSKYKPLICTVKQAHDSWGVESLDSPIPDNIDIIRSVELNLNKIVDVLDAIFNKSIAMLNKKIRKYYFRETLCIPDPQIYWLPYYSFYKKRKEICCIYVSSSPFSSAIIGVLAKKMLNVPLVLDFRDAWTINPSSIKHTPIYKYVSKAMEGWCIKNCDALILNTEGTLELYQDIYGDYKEKFYYLPNAYDSLNLPVQTSDKSEKFIIMHIGSFYGKRQPDNLLEALLQLNLEHVKFIQVGGGFINYNKYSKLIDIEIIESISHDKALVMMKKASLLYLKQGHDRENYKYTAVAAKTYEYLATGLPILADCPEGDNSSIIEKYGSCSYSITDQDIGKIKTAILNIYNLSNYEPSVKDEFKETFSRESVTNKLIDIIDKVVLNV